MTVRIASLAALALALAAAPLQAQVQKPRATAPEAQGASVTPPASYEGQWFTTPDGCTYSRAGAPGQAPIWIIVKNPRHIGKPNAHRGCQAMLQG
ncbi:hypothetical protein LR948_05100 [Roseivivax sp. GX 12232]|uniref:hypothetical protein n=1 Tax=Roseivivax sp. GX 12232 TaxID=2900547 RepID=UPI001E629565|nr:hypothetical protein [Roseivivax sp. GX 12232]MCE0504717.1 hypothetical protein [Roseivivax sp. GX 12232]